MNDPEGRALQAKDKTEVASPAEQTRPGLVFVPSVDIFETESELTLVADMPGVKAEDLDIGLEKNILTLEGGAASRLGEDETEVFTEYRTGKYYRQFTLSQAIDQAGIGAELKDGVLRLRLPKIAAATPRKITVNAS